MKSQLKVQDLSAMKPEELEKKIGELKTELFNLRFRLATGQLENVMQITAVKRDIARAKTVQQQMQTKNA